MKIDNPSKWFAREFLNEKNGRSVSKIIADGMSISIDEVHSLMFFIGIYGLLLFISRQK
ncbi:MAG: hypothetical protein QXD23_03610 [Candidatus Micrarchaeaceae archaeon]